MATTQSGVGLAMKFFGKLSEQPVWAQKQGKTGPQGLADFRDDWNRLTDEGKAELVAGLSDGSLTY
jgi:hypothetical protein